MKAAPPNNASQLRCCSEERNKTYQFFRPRFFPCHRQTVVDISRFSDVFMVCFSQELSSIMLPLAALGRPTRNSSRKQCTAAETQNISIHSFLDIQNMEPAARLPTYRNLQLFNCMSEGLNHSTLFMSPCCVSTWAFCPRG